MRIRYIFIVPVFIALIFSIDISYARHVRDVKHPATLYRYSHLNGKINRSERLTAAVYPYPVIITQHPIATAYCVKEEGLTDVDTIIYLSPYPCYQVGVIKEWQNSNWLRYVLENEYANRAFIVYPPYMKEESNIKRRFETKLSTAEHKISLLDNFGQLPEGQTLGRVVIVIDASYFSNKQTPQCAPTPEGLPFIVRNAVKKIGSRGLKIEAIVYNTSPGYSWEADAMDIQKWLLFYLGDQGN